jgi:hypothetical protein
MDSSLSKQQVDCDQILVLPLSHCVVLDNSFDISLSQLWLLKN